MLILHLPINILEIKKCMVYLREKFHRRLEDAGTS